MYLPIMETGAIMSVPAHDERDFEFANKHHLPIVSVIKPPKEHSDSQDELYTQGGILINSGSFNGLNSEEAKKKIIEHLEQNKYGIKTENYRLRDWLISRQRMWGTPIPMVNCENCGIVPVKEEDLPIHLHYSSDNNIEQRFYDCPQCSTIHAIGYRYDGYIF